MVGPKPTEKKTEIEEKVADALEENFDKHEMIAKAHNADNLSLIHI